MDIREHRLIDLEFALNQLNGNQALLFQLFQRFIQEYQLAGDKITEFKATTKPQQHRDYIHTLKGVTGNLGMSALMNACKEYEITLKGLDSSGQSEQHFLHTLTDTINSINSLINHSNTEQPSNSSKQILIKHLENEDLIAAPLLNKLLLELQLPSQQSGHLRQLIQDFKYREALALVKP